MIGSGGDEPLRPSEGQDWRIIPLAEVADPAGALAGIDDIFFRSSATQSFASEEIRAAFRERWLGRYLQHDPDLVFVAVAADGGIAGYIVGATEDPALLERFADLPFTKAFAHLSRDYPAHLHVNCAPQWRSRGIGAALVARLAAEAKARGARGLHLVTGARSRNRAFYEREGFAELGRFGEGDKQAVFLARAL